MGVDGVERNRDGESLGRFQPDGPPAHEAGQAANQWARQTKPGYVRRKIRKVLRVLEGRYGAVRKRPRQSPVDTLIATILSQNTSSANASAGFAELKDTFESWDSVADAPVEQIESCIRVSGLSQTKAPRIRNVLQRIRREHGVISLDSLASMSPEWAYDHLIRYDGVGPKTALCVLLFAFNMPVFPVDTHVHRVSVRLGLLPPNVSASDAHEILTPLIAPESRYPLHVLMIAHGRDLCRPHDPLCDRCPLAALCPFCHARDESAQRR